MMRRFCDGCGSHIPDNSEFYIMDVTVCNAPAPDGGGGIVHGVRTLRRELCRRCTREDARVPAPDVAAVAP
jgi:hypothetical protein